MELRGKGRITVPLNIEEMEELRSGLFFYKENLQMAKADKIQVAAVEALDERLKKKIQQLQEYQNTSKI